MNGWTATDVPDQEGRTAVVTGANTGIGFEAAKVLAERGARVVLACRDLGRAGDAVARIAASAPGARVSALPLDLGRIASVRAAAQRLSAEHPRIDLLVNNAGLMWAPPGRTEDGFETHLGVNHLGHFALTGLLLDRMLAVPGSRVVTVSSNGHKRGEIDFADLEFARRYRPAAAYYRSKLANLMFAYELQRRLAAAEAQTISVAAHPGNVRTELVRTSPWLLRKLAGPRWRWALSWLIQDPPAGALPTLRAATDPGVRGGEYYGPDGRSEFTGLPVRVESTARSHDADAQRRLWTESERLTGVAYPLPDRRTATR
jgi:NAD(P)-dependent dehydrogenase (short-subunit alcohol dehydrogenase family)